MIWSYYPILSYITIALWAIGIILLFSKSNRGLLVIGRTAVVAGIFGLVIFIVLLWIDLRKPPLQTLGETRLWYMIFLPITGFLLYGKWKYRWLLQYSLVIATVFIIINLANPASYTKNLMPALQSIWFVPHVTVYIMAYALLAVAMLVALRGLFLLISNSLQIELVRMADDTTRLGFVFLTAGLIMGAFWAKAAWGDYWTWDLKETWALLTWLGYLFYFHLRAHRPAACRIAFWILILSFLSLLICWFGVNYLPTAGNSIHTYSR